MNFEFCLEKETKFLGLSKLRGRVLMMSRGSVVIILHNHTTLYRPSPRTRGPGGLALAQFAKPFLETIVLGDEFVEPETRTYFYRLYI